MNLTVTRKITSALCLAIICTLSLHSMAQANNITVTPPLQSVELTPDQEVYQGSISYTNNYDQDITLTASGRDFGNLEEGGGLFFLGTNDQSQYKLTPWLTITPSSITIPAKQQQTITYTITNNQDLSPGGHYAAILATLSSDNDETIAINQSLSTLLFVNKQGGHVYKVEVDELQPQTAWWGQVEGATLNIKNNGNTHLTPRGKLELKDPLGNSIGQTIINNQSAILLPNSSQSFSSSLINNQLGWWPGNYQLVLSYRYDGQDEFVEQSKTIFSLGIIGLATIALIPSSIIGYIGYRRMTKKELH